MNDNFFYTAFCWRIEREGTEQFSAKNLTQQKAKVFNSYSGSAYTVSMRFRNELADAVIDQFGKDTLRIPLDGEHSSISVPVEISPPFFAWVASSGKRAKITGPAAVVAEITGTLPLVKISFQAGCPIFLCK